MKRKQRADVLSAFPGFAKMMLLLALLLWGGVQAKASSDSILQQSERTISGLVTDESGEPLIGVTVMVKGTRVGTTTNLDGVFTLKIPTNAGILQFSYMGMKTTELSIGSKSQFKVAMESDAVLIDDVVVIGYGTRSKKDMSISVSSVKGDELNNRPSALSCRVWPGKWQVFRIYRCLVDQVDRHLYVFVVWDLSMQEKILSMYWMVLLEWIQTL